MGCEQPSRLTMNNAGTVPLFLTSKTAVEGPIRATVELHNVLAALQISVDTTCTKTCTQDPAFLSVTPHTPSIHAPGLPCNTRYFTCPRTRQNPDISDLFDLMKTVRRHRRSVMLNLPFMWIGRELLMSSGLLNVSIEVSHTAKHPVCGKLPSYSTLQTLLTTLILCVDTNAYPEHSAS